MKLRAIPSAPGTPGCLWHTPLTWPAQHSEPLRGRDCGPFIQAQCGCWGGGRETTRGPRSLVWNLGSRYVSEFRIFHLKMIIRCDSASGAGAASCNLPHWYFCSKICEYSYKWLNTASKYPHILSGQALKVIEFRAGQNFLPKLWRNFGCQELLGFFNCGKETMDSW